MSCDLVCADAAFVDLTFLGLDALPAAGEERHARALLRSPGGAATVAIGAARLGLSVALAFPLGEDPEGDFVCRTLAGEGVAVTPRRAQRTSVTVVMPHGGERAMATYDADADTTVQDVARFAPRAVVLSVQRVDVAPPETLLYVTIGDQVAREHAGGAALPARVGGARALIVNAREARLLTGRSDAADAARALTAAAPRVVVTLGAEGALTAERERDVVQVPGVAVDHVADTTGAGDLFTAAYIWSDLAGGTPEDSMRWACLAAALSVRVPTAVAGAQGREALMQAGAEHGLAVPAHPSSPRVWGAGS